MMKKIYAEVTSECVNVFAMKSKQDVTSFVLPVEKSTTYNSKSAVLVANVRQTVIRVADISFKPAKSKWGLLLQRIRKINPISQWDVVKSTFPINDKMNENTHIFDGAIFANQYGKMRYFMIALPTNIINEITESCVTLFGNPHHLKRLDTIENILFRHYMKQGREAFWVMLPQGDGLRILFLTDGLPRAAWYVSNKPEFREDEVLRCLRDSIQMLEAQNIQMSEDVEHTIEINETALKRAVMLNTGRYLEWLCLLLEKQGVEVEQGKYCLGDFIRGR